MEKNKGTENKKVMLGENSETKDSIFHRKIQEVREQKGDPNYIMTQSEVSNIRKEANREFTSSDKFKNNLFADEELMKVGTEFESKGGAHFVITKVPEQTKKDAKEKEVIQAMGKDQNGKDAIFSFKADQLKKQLEDGNIKITKAEKKISDKENSAEKTSKDVAGIKNEIEKKITDKEKIKEGEEINSKIKTLGLSKDDLEYDSIWKNFSKAEKLLVLEQASQDTLSKVREIGEQRFQEKNKINLSLNPQKWDTKNFGKKIWHKIGKSFWISKEEKDVIKEAEEGKLKPDANNLNLLIKRQADMGLSVIEKDGKAYIEFVKENENLSKEDKVLFDRYNKTANEFSKMPDSWKNEKSAKSTDKMFSEKNFNKYTDIKNKYTEERNNLIESKVKQYENSGLSNKEARSKTMMEIKDIDYNIAMLQFTNTNPNALDELNKIREESSWKRLVNNENIWRGAYITMGYAGRSVLKGTLGVLAAPITSGAIGGIRARNKAIGNINKAFKEGSKEETFLERKSKGKKGLFDDKNKEQGAFSYLLSGEKVNTKDVAAFVDADSQKNRVENLINKINNVKNDKDKVSILSELEARLNYIEQKQEQGLINYGKENSVAKNYELFKILGEAYAIQASINNFNIDLTKEMRDDILEREQLLANIMARNEKMFGKEIARYKNLETMRGMVVSASFAALGGQIREWLHGDTENVKEIITPSSITKPAEIIINHGNVEAVADHGQGAISTLRELQHNLKIEYGNDMEHAPAGVKHILETDPHKLAMEYGMYKPNDVNESAFDLHSVKIDGKGHLTYQISGNHTDIGVDHNYDGKMFDSDHSGLKVETQHMQETPSSEYSAPEQVDPITGKHINVDHINTVPEQVDPITGEPIRTGGSNILDKSDLLRNTAPEQIDPTTGEPIHTNIAPEQINPLPGGVEHTQETIQPIVTHVEPIATPEHTPTNVNTTPEIIAGGEPIPLSPDQIRETMMITMDNQTHIFGDSLLSPNLADRIGGEEVGKFINSTAENSHWKDLYSGDRMGLDSFKEEALKNIHDNLSSYLHRLEKVSGLHPKVGSLLENSETVSHFETRALEEIARHGDLDKIKLE